MEERSSEIFASKRESENELAAAWCDCLGHRYFPAFARSYRAYPKRGGQAELGFVPAEQ